MDRYSVSRTKRSLFYIIMAFLTIGLIIAECVLPSERSQIASDENIIYDGSFTWLKTDGGSEAVGVSGRRWEEPSLTQSSCSTANSR